METKYQLIKDSYDTIEEDLTKLVSLINTHPGYTAQKNSENSKQILISSKQNSFSSKVELVGEASQEEGRLTKPALILSTESIDNLTPNFIKLSAAPLGFRLFSQGLNSFVPRDPSLLDIGGSILTEDNKAIMKAKNLKPIFYFRNSNAFYTEDLTDGSISFVNEFLLSYYLKFGFKDEATDEFSYKVAPGLKRFVPLFDEGLIPTHFYEFFKQELRIINKSGFDIEQPKRKVFIQPIIYTLNEQKQAFEAAAPKTSAALIADKIRQGETLDASLKRYLLEQEIADDYIGALVRSKIDFDRDRDGILTPRLIVDLYVEEVRNKERLEERSKRGWTSIGESGAT